MDEALVVFDADDTELLVEAGELTAGVDAGLTVLALMTEDEFDETREALDVVAAEEHTSYDDSVVIDSVRNEAREVLTEELGDLDVDYEIVGAVVEGGGGAAADRIIEIAENRDVDHVFMTGEKRSPTGKAVFGDRAQAVILNFDGPVTTLLD